MLNCFYSRVLDEVYCVTLSLLDKMLNFVNSSFSSYWLILITYLLTPQYYSLMLNNPFSHIQIPPHFISININRNQMEINKSWIQSFFFSRTGCLTKAKKLSVLLFTYNWGKTIWIHAFLKGISIKKNAISFVQYLNLCYWSYFLQWWSLCCVSMCVCV